MKTEPSAEPPGTQHVPFWAPPILAVQFLTRIPVPAIRSLAPATLQAGLARSAGWFPLVGGLIGLVTAAIIAFCDAWWPRAVAVLIALIIEARLTGAFHEDAVADACDALGGGRDPAHVREIMKDSRIGSYGALGLFLAAALRACLLVTLPASLLIPGTVASASFGRFLAVVTMRISPAPAVAQSIGKDIGTRATNSDLVLATVFVAASCSWFVFLAPLLATVALIAGLAFAIWFRGLVLLKVGGSTGDCLGFAAYAGQLIVLLAATIS